MNHHKFLNDFQPIEFGASIPAALITSAINWATLFGVAYVIGCGLKLGFN